MKKFLFFCVLVVGSILVSYSVSSTIIEDKSERVAGQKLVRTMAKTAHIIEWKPSALINLDEFDEHGKGITTHLEKKRMICVRDESVPPSHRILRTFAKRKYISGQRITTNFLDAMQWEDKDSLFIHLNIPPKGRVIFSIDTIADKIEIIELPDTLPSLVQEAVDYAPSWLRDDLIDNFRRLSQAYQTKYANLILSAPSLWIDEIAFQVAHISPEILEDPSFTPELITINTGFLYKNASLLDYVDIIDYGSDSSTTRYRVAEDDDTIEYKLPSKYYYIFIVHPELSDESPRMNGYVYNRFWRNYLFYAADSGYPILSEKLAGVKIMWDVADTPQVYPAGRSFDSTDCALDIIGNWVSETVPQAAMGNRPIQPNVIAHEHNGNCGEIQDVLQAAARAALIPTVAVMDVAEDHVWCEFYYKEWHEYQVNLGYSVTHINDFKTSYDRDVTGNPNGKEVSSVWNWRSDGYYWTVTQRYSKSCSLHVNLYDAQLLPVDGARLLIYAESSQWGGGLTTIGFTDSDGKCEFSLGNRRDFYISITSPIGDYPGGDSIVKIISGSQDGAHYYKSFYIDSFVPAPKAKIAPPPSDSFCVYKFDINLSVPCKFEHGYAIARRKTLDPNPFYHTYSEKGETGSMNILICDDTSYSGYLNEEEFKASLIGENLSDEHFSFITPYLSKWWLIATNEHALTSTKGVNLIVRLYKNPNPAVFDRRIAHIFRLDTPTPNPFVKSVSISYKLQTMVHTTLKIYDASGRLVKVLVDRIQKPGVYTVLWNGETKTSEKPVRAGIYFCRLTAGNYKSTKKIIRGSYDL